MDAPHCSSWRAPSPGETGFVLVAGMMVSRSVYWLRFAVFSIPYSLVPVFLSLRQAQHCPRDDAGNRDVEPQREGPAGNLYVLRNSTREREEEGDQNHWQSHDGQQNVAGEQRQVDRAQGRGA